MTRAAMATLGLLLFSSLVLGSGPACTTDDTATGNAGTTGGGGTGGGGGGAPFMAVDPCPSETDYQSGTTIDFSGTSYAYSPKCLKVAAGTTVHFTGDFEAHPLSPSARRGTLTGNPITATSTGMTKDVTFSTPGYYAYYCTFHGPSDGAIGMVGVVWVQ